ncbi:MAG TPA: hypothetical protein VGK45_18225 [Thermoanaerobaculia bacterium]
MLKRQIGDEPAASTGPGALRHGQGGDVALDLAHDLDGQLRQGQVPDRRQQVPLPHVGIRLDRRLAQNFPLGLSHVREKLLMQAVKSHGAASADGWQVPGSVLELARELKRGEPDRLDFLDRHVGVHVRHRVPAAMLADADPDGRFPDAETDQRPALLQDVVSSVGRGGPAESIPNRGGVDPGHRGMSGSAGHQSYLLSVVP